MTFSYNASIPQPGDNPSQSQGQMLTNFGSISSLVAVDHIGFDTANGGMHKQVSFPNTNPPPDPGSGTYTSELFTNLISSVPQLFFYTGTKAQSSLQYTQGASGSTFLFAGIILKWGTISFSTGSQSVTFGQAFPNNIFSVVLSADTTTPSSNGIVSFANPTTSGFTAYQNSNSPLTGYYIAIGN